MKGIKAHTSLRLGSMILLVFLIATIVASGRTALSYFTPAEPASSITGQWTARVKPANSGQVEILFLHRSPKYGLRMEFESMPVDVMNLTAVSNRVEFDLIREAGTFNLRGNFASSKGEGEWTLIPNPDFVSAMRTRGYDRLTNEDLYSAAIADLKVSLVDQLAAEGYGNLTFHDLFEAAAFHVTPEFIREVKAKGAGNPPFARLVQLRLSRKK